MHHSTLAAVLLLIALTSVAQARPARCQSTDEGAYPCDFTTTDSKGSFRISARARPTYTIEVDEPGVASAFVNLGTRNVSLPGPHRLSKSEPGCWVSDATETKICAR